MIDNNPYLGVPLERDLDHPLFIQNYFGPGVYRHYKGGLYIAFGLMRVEYNDHDLVAYMTLDAGRQRDNYYRGRFSIGRPLNFSDGPDPFNSYARAEVEFTVEELRRLQTAPVLSNDDIRNDMVRRFARVA